MNEWLTFVNKEKIIIIMCLSFYNIFTEPNGATLNHTGVNTSRFICNFQFCSHRKNFWIYCCNKGMFERTVQSLDKEILSKTFNNCDILTLLLFLLINCCWFSVNPAIKVVNFHLPSLDSNNLMNELQHYWQKRVISKTEVQLSVLTLHKPNHPPLYHLGKCIGLTSLWFADF